MISGLRRYIATTETAKFRFFQFMDSKTLIDHGAIGIGLDDAVHLGVLSCEIHVIWAIAAGGRLGVGNDPRYNKTRCFDPFPFPLTNHEQHSRIAHLAEQLDAHRKRQQAAYPDLTLTGMYNVLEKLRSGDVLTAKERVIHEHGIVSVLRQLHDEIDAAVLDAYGWSDLLPLLRRAMGLDANNATHSGEAASVGAPPGASFSSGAASAEESPSAPKNGLPAVASFSDMPPKSIAPKRGQAPGGAPTGDLGNMDREDARRAFDEAILERLVALNAERAAEEARGLVRWLRPEFQNPTSTSAPEQAQLDTDSDDDSAAAIPATFKPAAWPKDAIEQVRAVADTLAASPIPLNVDELATRFRARGAWKKRLPQLLEMLVTLGRAQESDGRYSGIGK